VSILLYIIVAQILIYIVKKLRNGNITISNCHWKLQNWNISFNFNWRDTNSRNRRAEIDIIWSSIRIYSYIDIFVANYIIYSLFEKEVYSIATLEINKCQAARRKVAKWHAAALNIDADTCVKCENF